MIRFLPCLLLLLAAAHTPAEAQGLRTINPRVEYLDNPAGIDVPDPRFSWALESNVRGAAQSAYQIVLAGSLEELRPEMPQAAAGGPAPDRHTRDGVLWNSGKVASERSINIVYDGPPLESSRRYYWKVRAWDEKDGPGPWSATATFIMGILNPEEWAAEWIGSSDPANRAPRLRKEFELKGEVASAYAHVSGLGFYELYLNGEKVGDHVLDPAPTQYEVRVLYATYDVTEALRKGANAVGLWLAEGQAASTVQDSSRFFSLARPYPGETLFDTPRGLLQLEITYANGKRERVVTDPTWTTSTGPITFNHFYGGEDYDARLESPGWSTPGFDDAAWTRAQKKEVSSRLSAQLMPPMKVVDTLRPIAETQPAPGTYVYDLGQNIGGWWRIRVRGDAGTRVVVRGSETLDDEVYPKPLEASSTISMEPHHGLGGYFFRDALTTYTLKGNGLEEYEPRFFYSGFRYVQVEVDRPLAELFVEGRAVHTDVVRVGEFASSNELFNRIHRNSVWTLKGIMQGAPMSNPHSEKYGWTGDAHLFAEAANHVFDLAAFWRKWLQDIRDSQQHSGGGRFPSTVPNYRKAQGATSSVWGAAFPLTVWYNYAYYDDEDALRENYDGLKAWTDYLASRAENHILDSGIGEHVPPGFTPEGEDVTRNRTPEFDVFASTAYYYLTATILSEVAERLNRDSDASHYGALARNIRDAFNKKYFDEGTGTYQTEPTPPGYDGVQTANLIPLELGLVPAEHRERVAKNVARAIVEEHERHLTTGIVATKSLVNVLPDEGYAALLYDVASQRTYPSWGFWIEKHATTHWQEWGGRGDQNHAMFGSIDEFFFNELAGIQAPTDPGTDVAYRKVHIKPFIPDTMRWASAEVETVRGRLSSAWERQGENLTLEVTLPPGTTGVVSVPVGNSDRAVIIESGKVIWENGSYRSGNTGLSSAAPEEGYVRFDVTSGSYEFEVRAQ